jgi:transposase
MSTVLPNMPEAPAELVGLLLQKENLLEQKDHLLQQQEELLRKQTQRISLLEEKLHWFEEQFHLARAKQYGPSSERSVPEQASLFNEAEAVVESTPTPEEEQITVQYERKRKAGRRPIPQDLPVERIEYRLPEEEKVCSCCGGPMHEMSEQSRHELKVIPAQVKLVEHVRYVYGCRSCEQNGVAVPIKTAAAPVPVIEKGLASPSAMAYSMTMKFVEGVPLYRQEQHFQRLGIELSRAVLSNWMIKGSEWLELLYRQLQEKLLERDILHADETTVQVLKEPGRAAESQSYMWLYRTGREGPAIVLYDYQQSRASEHPQRFLKGFKGYLHADGYAGYQDLTGVALVGCWAHARRKFDEALKGLPAKQRKAGGSQAQAGLDQINRLFAIEREAQEYTPEERKKIRQEKSQPVVECFRQWLDDLALVMLPKSLLGMAVNYCRNQWPKLIRFLEDGRLELSNNRAERAIKPFVIGRKNWLFSNTPKGAKSSAIIYSLIETAKENNLDPYAYLTLLFEKLPNLPYRDNEDIDPLLPWNVDLEPVRRSS